MECDQETMGASLNKQVGKAPVSSPGKNEETAIRTGLEVPFNFDMALFDFFDVLNTSRETKHPVRVVYAADRFSLTGSGRAASSLSERRLPIKDYVQAAHAVNVKFHWLYNAPNLGNREWTPEFRKKLRAQMEELVEAGVDCCVAAHPVILDMLRQWAPELKRGTSVNTHLDSVERARQIVEFPGVSTIMMDHRNVRNFSLIRELRKAFPTKEIIVLVNESCLRDCVYQSFHQAALSAASQIDGCVSDPDFCHLCCGREKLSRPENTLKAPWIRPEDIKHVFEAGGTLVKLAGRTESTAWIREVTTAYATGVCEGDVFRFIEKSGLTNRLWEGLLGKSLPPCRFKVDNAKLDGFIDPFVKGTVPCVKGAYGCGACDWCNRHMHAVEFPQNQQERRMEIEELLRRCGRTDLYNNQGISQG